MMKFALVGVAFFSFASLSHADMFSNSSETSTFDAHCSKQERDSGRCERDRRYTENPRPPVYIDNRNNGSYYDERRYDERYNDRRNTRQDPNWKEKHDIRTEDEFERQRRKDQEYYDNYGNNKSRSTNNGSSWKEKHDIQTEDEFERQRRKDQEYYDKH